jgi:hypothetical protein
VGGTVVTGVHEGWGGLERDGRVGTKIRLHRRDKP